MEAENKTIKMTVNHLPVLTWNKLKMNAGTAEIRILPLPEAAEKESLPAEGITVSRQPLQKAAEWMNSVGGQSAETYVGGKVGIYAEQAFATGLGAEFDAFLLANAALSTRVYTVEAGAKPEAPVLLHADFGSGANGYASVVIYAKEGAEATFVMDYTSDRDAAGFSAVSTKVYCEKGAVVHLKKINLLGSGFLQLDDTGAVLDDDAAFDFLQMELGGAQTFAGCCVNQLGQKSRFTGSTGYLCRGTQKLDMNYAAVQRGKKTESDMAVKGVLLDHAEKMFRGTIDFRNGSAGSVGNEQEDTLLLSPDVHNKTIPLILCEEEDVDGRHGATIGRLSEDLLFYLETRGLSEKDAERIMIRGRLDGIAREIPDETIRNGIHAFVEEAFGNEELE